MEETMLSAADKQELFNNQKENGPFSAIATVAAGLNYLDRLNRKRLDLQATSQERTIAGHKLISLEKKLFLYARKQTPLSLFDADYRQEADAYIQMRVLFLKATTLTFKRHRFSFLLDLIRLYRDDPCCILTGREAYLEKWEKKLLYDYLLFDMSARNTADVGKEAISNGYHECDFTLDIESFLQQPRKSVPRSCFKYVIKSMADSPVAACVIAYMKEHITELSPALWTVDDQAIWTLYKTGAVPTITKDDIDEIAATYQK